MRGLKPATSWQNFQKALTSQRGLWFKGLIRCWSSSLNIKMISLNQFYHPCELQWEWIQTENPQILHHTAYLVWKNIMWYKCGHIGHKLVLSVLLRAVNIERLGGWSAWWLMPRSFCHTLLCSVNKAEINLIGSLHRCLSSLLLSFISFPLLNPPPDRNDASESILRRPKVPNSIVLFLITENIRDQTFSCAVFSQILATLTRFRAKRPRRRWASYKLFTSSSRFSERGFCVHSTRQE